MQLGHASNGSSVFEVFMDINEPAFQKSKHMFGRI